MRNGEEHCRETETPPNWPKPKLLACRIPLMTSTETRCLAITDRNKSRNLRSTTPRDMDLLKNPDTNPNFAVKSAQRTTQLTRSVVLFVPHFHRPWQTKSLMALRKAEETKQPLRRMPSQSCGSNGALSTPTYSREDLKLGWMFHIRSAKLCATFPHRTAFWKACSACPSTALQPSRCDEQVLLHIKEDLFLIRAIGAQQHDVEMRRSLKG